MTGTHPRGRSRRRVALAAAAAVVALGAAGAILAFRMAGDGGSAGVPRPVAASTPQPSRGSGPAVPAALLPPLPNGPTGPAHASLPGRLGAAQPVRLTVPSIGVNSRLERLSLLSDGTLQPPTRWGQAGWYAGGPRPGEPGPAVIAGHVDSVSGPAVFFRLRALRPGAIVTVRDARGTAFRFVVDGSRTYPKDRFPTSAVYGPTPLPELRLVTCTGDFDYARHSYLDNLVVSAHLAAVQRS
jgi:hypothetical protein